MQFSDIFQRYFMIYRGRSTNLPASGSREYNLALEYANDAIDEWARMDGMQWPELWTTSAEEDGLTVSDGTIEYDVSDMAEPPAKVKLSSSGQSDRYLQVIKPWEINDYGEDLDGYVYFTGTAPDYTMHVSSNNASEFDGYTVDFPYYKTPTQMTNDSSVPDMSDPSYMVHHMVALRAQKQRNGFLFKSSAQKARERLLNMKVKATAGTYGNSSRQKDTQPGWGSAGPGTSIFRG